MVFIAQQVAAVVVCKVPAAAGKSLSDHTFVLASGIHVSSLQAVTTCHTAKMNAIHQKQRLACTHILLLTHRVGSQYFAHVML